MEYSYIKQNFDFLTEECQRRTEALGVPPVTLVCVTKSGTDDEVLALAAAGAADMAENRPQELARRDLLLRAHGFSPRMHEVGNLQSNKVKLVLDHAALIHSVSSLPLAQEIERQAEKRGIRVPVLMEINSGAEENKSGFLPADAFAAYEALLALPHLSCRGLMTMAPLSEAEEDYRPYFRATKGLLDEIARRYGYDTDTPILSMGMSDSYRVAIEEGSTLVRIGRRLFRQ